MNTSSQRILNTFLAGLLAVLPLVATLLLIGWFAQFLHHYLGPGSWFGDLLSVFGFGLVDSERVSYLIGLGITIVAIFVLGVLVRTGLARAGQAAVTALVKRIPIVRNVYDVVTSLVDLVAQKDNDKLKSMSAVWLHFGGVGGSAVLGLLSTKEPVRIGELSYLAVLVPTAPVPIGGGLLYVPESWVVPADIGMEAVTSIYVSMGVTSAQYLPVARSVAGAASPVVVKNGGASA
ncbi:MAG: DUF502 domain-containing protein [Burkholderiales bacterium]|nr:MAG: DUF502 domain-containing protein [Burkholderiales bacterium]TAG81566.1 MAG: DUF502 domain-containing protein [Betaproteobacteria bacterium]